MLYDKINGDVAFKEKEHLYFNVKDDSIKYISVTTLIEKYGQPFDSEFVSTYKALEKLLPPEVWKKEKGIIWKAHKIPKGFFDVYNINQKQLKAVQQEILDEWQRINKEACEKGTRIHAELENSMYQAGDNVKLDKYGIGGKFQCKKNYNTLDLEYGVYPEYLIYYDNPKLNLHLAGQIDLLIKDGNTFSIGDYKSNREIKTKGFFNSSTRTTTKMKYPLNNLDECNLSHYYLQLSTYAWMIQKLRPDLELKYLKIIHFGDKGETIYDVPYLKNEVERMLKHYAKTQTIEKQKSKYERIEY